MSKLATRIAGSSTIGNRRTDHYQIKAVLRDAREIVVANDIKAAGFVTTLVRLLQRHLKLGDPD